MKSRHGLGVLAVCGLVYGLMALSAPGAQATGCTAKESTLKPCWMINGANITSSTAVTAGAEKDGATWPVLLTKSGQNTVAIECTAIEGSITAEAEGKATGTVNFSGCTTQVNGETHPECNPTSKPIKAGGEGEIALHEGTPVFKAKGTGGGAFTTIEFDETKCTLIAEPITISGTGWVEEFNKHFEEETVEEIEVGGIKEKVGRHLIQEDVLAAAMLGGLKFGANPAKIDGSVWVKLTDAAHKNQPFSGLAG